jgi:hypothetical protein
MKNVTKRWVAILLSLSFMGSPMMTAQAAMVSTGSLLTQQQESNPAALNPHLKLKAQLDREAVQQKLLELGASPDQIKERIDHLTLAEAQKLNEQIEMLPAGGLIGTLALIFVVFVITDAIGATDVFTFVDPVR